MRPVAYSATASPGLAALGRSLLVLIFLVSGINKVLNPAGVVQSMAGKGLPSPEILAWVVIGTEIAGALLIMIGWQARTAAVILALFTIAAAVFYHNFWPVEAAQFQNQMNHFMKNVAIAGGLLFLAALGSGRQSAAATAGPADTA